MDNETWIIEAGDDVIQRRSNRHHANLSALDRLIYCLWVADYSIRNAVDLETARELHPAFHEDARQLARDLALDSTYSAFELSGQEFEAQYFDRFDAICAEIRAAATQT